MRKFQLLWLALLPACGAPDGGPVGGERSRTFEPGATGGEVSEPGPDAAVEQALTPAAPRLARLTRLQYHNAVRDLFGPDIAPPSALEPDASVEGLRAIGGTVTALSPRGVEQAYEGAKALADQMLATPERRAALLPCQPASPDDSACLEDIARTWGLKLWRRPLEADEVTTLRDAALHAGAALDTTDAATHALLVQLLASPSFLYRVELGEPDPNTPGGRRYTGWEMAQRLSFFLWNTVPDAELTAAAERGELTDEAGLAAQVERMLADPRWREGLRNLFAEWLDLYALDELSKDPNTFRHYSTDLGPAAREETLAVVEHLFLTEDHDYRELYTTRTTFVNRRLAAIYNVPAAADEGFARIDFPEGSPRAGILGHVSFLALHSHPTASSATRRGVALRKRVLCQDVPSPPANLNTAIPEPSPDARTLKERLESHQLDPACGGCHTYIDPPGYGLENFDGIGRFRLTDNEATIDPTGEIDGEVFGGPSDLYTVIANHEALLPCAVRTVYAYANGHLPERGEKSELARLLADFQANGNRIRHLMGAVARSPGFRRVGEPLPEAPEETGETP